MSIMPPDPHTTDQARRLTYGSLCSGAGGLDLAVEEVFGATAAWHVELDPAASLVLAARWPGVRNYRDVKLTHYGRVPRVDILTAGYPCQPFSHAGRRRGTDDPRHLWPFIAEAVRRIRPRYVVLENVSGHRSLGFDVVLGEMAEARYDLRWTSILASDIGAPHRRERIFILAEDTDRAARSEWRQSAPGQAQGGWARADAGGRGGASLADARDGTQPERARQTGRFAGEWAPVRGEPGCDRVATADAYGSRFQGHGAVPARPELIDADRDHFTTPDAYRDALREQPVPESGRSGEAVAGLAVQRATPADADESGRGRLEELDRGAPARINSEHRGHTDGRGNGTDWGTYTSAIRRWERALGRVAPAPTEPNTRGGQRLAARFVEWMQGYPEGWVCDVPGISRNDMLRILGNSVVRQQGAAALRRLLPLAHSLEGVA